MRANKNGPTRWMQWLLRPNIMKSCLKTSACGCWIPASSPATWFRLTRIAGRVSRNHVAGLDAGIQHPHALVFKQDFMMFGRSNHCIQRVGPFLFARILVAVVVVHSLML